jgi:signal transduction histidine kinase
LADASGDYALALKSYQRAHAVFVRLGILRSQAIALLGLGAIYEKARDFNREIRYYREASQVYSGEPAFNLSVANNTGFALQQIGRYGDALDDYKRALTIAISLKSSMLEARVLTNVAMSEARLGKLGEADSAANRALRLLGPKDESGWAPFKADIEYQRGALKIAVADLEKAFHGLDLATTIAAFRDAHEIAYKVYRAAGNYSQAIVHLEAFKRLDDEGRSVAASANLALTTAQFDFTNQQLEIAKLKAAQLERDISLKESRSATQAIVFAGAALACLVLMAWIAWRHVLVRRHRNAIRQKNVKLLQTLAERNREIVRRAETESQLRIAMEVAQQANRAKSHFLANMSHELRTPLNAIIGFSELLVARAVEPRKVREYASGIAEGGRHLLSILNDVLDMARIEAGRVTLDETTIRLGDVVSQVISELGDEIRADGKRIQFDEANGGIHIRADGQRLQQILTNLVSNAIKFTDADGVVQIQIEPVFDGVDLVIRDNGAGIPSDKLDVIMEPFGQAENAYARAHGGSGLGLPIVKALVELHGGRFVITSGAARGTVARVHLPADRILDEENPGHPESKVA